MIDYSANPLGMVPLVNQMTADSAAISSTSLTNVLTVTLPHTGTYLFEGFVTIRGNGTSNVAGIAVGGTSTPSAWRWVTSLSATTASNNVVAVANGTTSYAAAGSTLTPAPATQVNGLQADIRGLVTITAVGTFTIAVSRISGTGTFVVASNSILVVKKT